METIEFKPNRLIPFKRSIEFIIKLVLFAFFIFLIVHFGIIDFITNKNINDFSIYYNNFTIIIIVFFYIIWKLISTRATAIDYIRIDKINNLILINFYLFYFIKNKVQIEFKEFSFKSRNEPLILGHSYAIYFYKNKSLIAKLNGMNGWKRKDVKEIELLLIEICKDNERKYKIGW